MIGKKMIAVLSCEQLEANGFTKPILEKMLKSLEKQCNQWSKLDDAMKSIGGLSKNQKAEWDRVCSLWDHFHQQQDSKLLIPLQNIIQFLMRKSLKKSHAQMQKTYLST